MRTRSALKVIAVIGVCMFLGGLSGCAGLEYGSCRTKEGIAKANEAASMAKALCPVKPVPVVVAPPPPPALAPTVSLSANPPAIDPGKCTTLFWSSENASGASIDQGIGDVGKSGSRQVCPTATTLYTINATGEGGSQAASTMVTVYPPLRLRIPPR